ncbi:MAG TPA: TolC family protein [Bryobacteraceae bacterium]|jgi:outer membrane protein TolC|nr:TolC family protein [Bryobacteraceae bacterium]
MNPYRSLIGVCFLLFASAAAVSAASLAALLDEAAHRNPDIAAALSAWQASTQVSSQVSVLPDPQVTVQQFAVGSPRPFAGFSNSGFAYVGFGVSQDIPWPGKLRLRSEAADRDAAVGKQKFEAARREVFEQISAAYFQIGYLRETLTVLERDQALLDRIEKIAEARYRLGQGNQQEVLKAQLEKTKILNEIAHHHGLMDSQQAVLKKLLNRSPGEGDITVDEVTETPLNYTADELMARVRTENPDVSGQQEVVRKQSLEVEIARRDRYPDFNVQYMWQHNAEQFRDYYMLTFSARLPIYRKRRLDPELTQAVDELNRARREYESHVQRAFFDIRDQVISVDTASQMLKIYREGLIPQALATFRAGLAGYQAGNQDFETLLSAFRDVLGFDEEYWKSLADRETALARIEQIAGVRIH